MKPTYLNRKINIAEVHENLRMIVFRMTLSSKSRIHRGNTKVLPLIKTNMRKTLDLQVNSGKLMEIMMDSDIIFGPPEKDTKMKCTGRYIRLYIKVLQFCFGRGKRQENI